ncbi:MAG: GTP pyrophosphokinase family protein [Bacilli bacterium]|nr:GTP pyrophosphokinase family protein [Bacilli bacterium]
MIEQNDEFKKKFMKYEFAKERLQNEINILIKEYEYELGYNPVEHTKTRIKTLESAENKLRKRNYEVTFENLVNHIHDIVGIRIVCSFLSDVYEIANRIQSSKQFKIENVNDYIKNPKPSGYTSYHINVLIPIDLYASTEYIEAEIQIRTIAMDCWSSLDHKLRYKLPENIPEEIKTELKNRAEDMKELDKKMEDLHQMTINYINNEDII